LGGVVPIFFRALFRGKKFIVVSVKPLGGDLEKINVLIDDGKLQPVVEHI
jgi:hypothetical protein